MPLDFYYISDKKYENLLFSWDDAAFEALTPVLAELTRLTGVYIDQYAKSRIYQDHFNLLLSLLEKQIGTPEQKKSDHHEKLLSEILKKLKGINGDLIAFGD